MLLANEKCHAARTSTNTTPCVWSLSSLNSLTVAARAITAVHSASPTTTVVTSAGCSSDARIAACTLKQNPRNTNISSSSTMSASVFARSRAIAPGARPHIYTRARGARSAVFKGRPPAAQSLAR